MVISKIHFCKDSLSFFLENAHFYLGEHYREFNGKTQFVFISITGELHKLLKEGFKSRLKVDHENKSTYYIYAMEDELYFHEDIKINGKIYSYIMTSSFEVLKNELQKYGCRLPKATDYRYNPSLHIDVRKRMAERKSKWSLTTSHGVAILNFYAGDAEGKGTSYIVYLSEIVDIGKISMIKNSTMIKLFYSIAMNKKKSALVNGWSPLMFAVSQRHKEIVECLLENGADPNFSDEQGFTPLMLASFLNEAEIVKILIEKGANLNLCSKTGFSALSYAIYANSVESVKALIQNNAEAKLSITPKVLKERLPFIEVLEFYISTVTLNGLGDISLIYKRGGLSKQIFSKIRSQKKSSYRPRKNTVLQLAIGMTLSLSQTESLLESAGYFFSEKDKVDQVVKEHILQKDYDIIKINSEIYEKTGTTFLKE